MKIVSLIVLLLFSCLVQAVDLRALNHLFKKTYHTSYNPRFCGLNIQTFISAAQKKKIDLSGAYVLKIVGGGFLETSAFYSRQVKNQRVMLGYFHYVLVANNHIFDFDLGDSLVLDMESYIRLQFTPPRDPYHVAGNIYFNSKKELPDWKLSRYELAAFLQDDPNSTWQKEMRDLIDMDRMLSLDRQKLQEVEAQ